MHVSAFCTPYMYTDHWEYEPVNDKIKLCSCPEYITSPTAKYCITTIQLCFTANSNSSMLGNKFRVCRRQVFGCWSRLTNRSSRFCLASTTTRLERARLYWTHARRSLVDPRKSGRVRSDRNLLFPFETATSLRERVVGNSQQSLALERRYESKRKNII